MDKVRFSLPIQAIKTTKNPPIRAIFIVHPNSPTANALTDRELAWLKCLPEHILVIVDEAYFEFCQNTLVEELPQRPNWVVMRTFSKAFRLAAMRVGYCVGHPELIAVLEKVRLPYNVPSFSLVTALLAIQNRQLLLASIPQILRDRTTIIDILSQKPELQVWNSATNFVYLQLKSNTSISSSDFLTDLYNQMKSTGTLVRQTGGGIRITIGTSEENARTLMRMQAALEQLKSKLLI